MKQRPASAGRQSLDETRQAVPSEASRVPPTQEFLSKADKARILALLDDRLRPEMRLPYLQSLEQFIAKATATDPATDRRPTPMKRRKRFEQLHQTAVLLERQLQALDDDQSAERALAELLAPTFSSLFHCLCPNKQHHAALKTFQEALQALASAAAGQASSYSAPAPPGRPPSGRRSIVEDLARQYRRIVGKFPMTTKEGGFEQIVTLVLGKIGVHPGSLHHDICAVLADLKQRQPRKPSPKKA